MLGLTVVLPSGEVIRTRSRARKSSAGCDITSLFVGAEGTLGVITEVVLRVYPVPEATSAAVFNDRLVRRAIAMEGTCTGEHGVGYGKQPYLELEHGAAALDLIRRIKHAIDPDDLMNPGKVVAHRAGQAPPG